VVEKSVPVMERKTPPMPGEITFGGVSYTPRVDIYETVEEVVVLCDLPGVKPGNVELSFEGGELMLHGKVVPPGEPAHCLVEEYGVGDFYRLFAIPVEVNAEKIFAEYRYGVLTIHLPKIENVKPRRIPIKPE
jgi:HSP20 family protein